MLVTCDEYGSILGLSRCPKYFLHGRVDESTGTCARQHAMGRTPVTVNGWHYTIDS